MLQSKTIYSLAPNPQGNPAPWEEITFSDKLKQIQGRGSHTTELTLNQACLI